MTIAHSVFTSSFHLCSCGKVTTTPLLIFHELHRIIIYALFGDITAASSRSLHGSQGISYDFFEKVRYTIFRNRTLQSKAFQKIAPSSAPSLPNSHCAIDFFESLAQTSSPSSPPPNHMLQSLPLGAITTPLSPFCPHSCICPTTSISLTVACITERPHVTLPELRCLCTAGASAL